MALTYVLVSDMIPLRERGKWFGAISLQWAVGSAIGPVIGGKFAETDVCVDYSWCLSHSFLPISSEFGSEDEFVGE